MEGHVFDVALVEPWRLRSPLDGDEVVDDSGRLSQERLVPAVALLAGLFKPELLKELNVAISILKVRRSFVVVLKHFVDSFDAKPRFQSHVS